MSLGLETGYLWLLGASIVFSASFSHSTPRPLGKWRISLTHWSLLCLTFLAGSLYFKSSAPVYPYIAVVVLLTAVWWRDAYWSAAFLVAGCLYFIEMHDLVRDIVAVAGIDERIVRTTLYGLPAIAILVALNARERRSRPGGTAANRTKLELAKAYLEIGDKERARKVLEQVLNGGSPPEREDAKRLIGGDTT